MPLPRHAIMGLTGHAWHLCLGSREGVVALPSGPLDVDREAMAARDARTGLRLERFGAGLSAKDDWSAPREAAIEWATAKLDAGSPLIGFDFHLHEFGIVNGYDRERGAFLVEDVLTPEVGPIALWDSWPSSVGLIELLVPAGPSPE